MARSSAAAKSWHSCSFAWCLVKETRPLWRVTAFPTLNSSQSQSDLPKSFSRKKKTKKKNGCSYVTVTTSLWGEKGIFSICFPTFFSSQKWTQSVGCYPFNLIRGNREAIVGRLWRLCLGHLSHSINACWKLWRKLLNIVLYPAGYLQHDPLTPSARSPGFSRPAPG